VDDALLPHVGGELVRLDVAQEVDRALAVEGENVIVEGPAVERGDLSSQLGDRHQAALRDTALARLADDVLEGFVIQTPLSVGQTITLRGRPEAAP
jgi:hypothetical protein